MKIPEEHIFYENPSDLFYRNIDPAIQELIWEINQTTWMRSICSCAGHPNSERLSEWSNDKVSLVVCVKKAEMEKFEHWKELITKGTPKRYEDRSVLTRMGAFIGRKTRKTKMELYEEVETDEYQNLKLVYNIDTIGERNCMIELMRESLREVEM